MISLSVPLFLIFPLFMMKESFLLSCYFNLGTVSFFIISIFPMILMLVYNPMFSFSSQKDKVYYMFIFSLVFVSLLFCFCSSNSFFFLVFLENCVMLMVLFIVFFSKDLDKVSSSLFMFFINILPSILFMYFCCQFNFSLDLYCLSCEQSQSIFTFFCFMGLLASKLPLFLYHFWLTKAHVSASGCGSMILASVMLKLGSMGLVKFYPLFMIVYSFLSSFIFSFVAWFTIIILVVMVRFFDLKYLVACSSIIHMNPIFCLTLFGDSFSLLGSCLMQVGHGLISCLIFFLITLMYEICYHRSLDQNKNFSGSLPIIFMFIFTFFLINLGFPPLCSFMSELIFCFSFLNFSVIIFLLFCSSMILSGIIFFIVVSKSIFGKKLNSPIYVFSTMMFIIFYSFFFIYLFVPFFFF